jgi:Zn-dependent protease with chaperone function
MKVLSLEDDREGGMTLRKKVWAFLAISFLFFSVLPFPPAFAGTPSKEDEKEIALGKKVCEQVEEKWQRVADPVRVARLQAILQRILPEAKRPLEYEVRLIEDDQPNAFSLPGGFIYFTTGMIQFAKSDAELAAIMAHEMVHAEKKHVMIQSARNERLSLIALAVAVASKGEAAAVIMANVVQVAVLNAYSRDLEKEADYGALEILHDTGFPVASAVTVMERLAEERLKHPYVDPGVFMDHPDLPERIDYLIRKIKDSGWPLNRKEPLHLLRTAVAESGSLLLLTVDGKPAWSGQRNDVTRSFLEGIRRKLDQSLQMELLPNDIALFREAGDVSVRVGPQVIVRGRDLPDGMGPLEELAGNLRKAIIDAKRTHPMGHYLL